MTSPGSRSLGTTALRRVDVAAVGATVPLIERSQALAVLSTLLAEVRVASQGRLVLVGGEAGVGKSALLRTFCALECERSRILWGYCEPLRAPRPLGPLTDVAEGTGGELADLVATGARPHEVAASLLRELRAGGPTVLVIEDLHWADEATLDVLTLLATRIESAPALVLASYRDEELERSQQLRQMLGEVMGRRGRLKVEPLTLEAVVELARRHGVDGDELHRTTGGNAFFVTEVLAAGGERIPETVREAVLARLAQLSGPARRLLEAIAIIPGQVDLWLLERLGGELLECLEECAAAGVLSMGRSHVAFRHELARLATEEAIAPNRRIALHRAALAALTDRADRDPDLARLSHHADAAGDAAAVSRWAPRAAERAASSGAHREAAAQYRRALRFADALALRPRAELLQRCAEELRLSAQFDEAIAAEAEALACYRRIGDLRGEGDSLRSLSRLLFFAGRTSEGEPAALEAVELLARLPAGHELAMAYGNLSQRRMVVQETAEAITWGARALELAQRLGDAEALVYALENIGAAEFDAGRQDGWSKLERALELARRHDLDDYAGRAAALLVNSAVRQRRFDLARAHLEAGLEYCTERGLETWRTYLLADRARLALDLGEWNEAGDSATSVLRDPRTPPVARSWALATVGVLRARRGDADVSPPLDEADALVRSTGELMRTAPVAAARAEAAWVSGASTDIEQLTDAALSLAVERRDPWVVGELAFWRWQAGLHDALPAELVSEPYRLSIAGDWARAAESWTEIGCPYETALALAQSDNPAILRQALRSLHHLGARPAAAIVARRLRERGVRSVPRGPYRQTRSNVAGLTPREVEVLALLVEGLRNAQIAQRLVVSQRTVDHHVSAVLRKLEVRTRGEAAAAGLRQGLVRPA